jgi:hypothetical protein
MFLWNMLGAMVLLPALAHFLLTPSTPVNDATSVKGVKDVKDVSAEALVARPSAA